MTSHPRPTAALAALLLALLPAWAAAQVTRCTDPATGKVTYTDGRCAPGTTAQEVEPRKTPEEIQQEREQAAEALERRRERLALEAQQERLQAERAARERAAAPVPAAGNDPSRTPECQRARRQLQEVAASLGQGMYDEQARLDSAQRQADLACLSPADYAEAERARANRPAYAPPYYAPPVVVVPPRPRPPRPAPTFTHCNVFRCYDKQGNTYPR